jgi:predicted ATPase
MLTAACRFDGISNLLKAQSGLHGAAGPHGQRPAAKGLYMYGGVGCGKTMLMDLLVASAPREFQVATQAQQATKLCHQIVCGHFVSK